MEKPLTERLTGLPAGLCFPSLCMVPLWGQAGMPGTLATSRPDQPPGLDHGLRWGSPSHPSCWEEGALRHLSMKDFLVWFSHPDPTYPEASTGGAAETDHEG